MDAFQQLFIGAAAQKGGTFKCNQKFFWDASKSWILTLIQFSQTLNQGGADMINSGLVFIPKINTEKDQGGPDSNRPTNSTFHYVDSQDSRMLGVSSHHPFVFMGIHFGQNVFCYCLGSRCHFWKWTNLLVLGQLMPLDGIPHHLPSSAKIHAPASSKEVRKQNCCCV